jgi:hypothetical protein
LLGAQLTHGEEDVTGHFVTVGTLAVPIEESARQVSLVDKKQSLLLDGAVELQESRNIYGHYYQLPDGRRAALIPAAPINYKALDGYAFTNAANSFLVYFPDQTDWNTDILSYGPTGAEIRLWNQGEIWFESTTGNRELLYQAEASEGAPEEKSIFYPERYPDVTEVFTVKYEGIKHSYVINNPFNFWVIVPPGQ